MCRASLQCDLRGHGPFHVEYFDFFDFFFSLTLSLRLSACAVNAQENNVTVQETWSFESHRLYFMFVSFVA